MSRASLAKSACRSGSKRAQQSLLWQLIHALVFCAPVFHAGTAWAGDDGWKIDAEALASQPEPTPPPPTPVLTPLEAQRAAPLVFDLQLLTGVGWAKLSQDNDAPPTPQPTNFVTGCAGVSLGIGRFAGSHVKISYEASGGVQRVLGKPETADARGYSPPQKPVHGNTGYFFPVGAYLAIYPWATRGISLGVHLGMGMFWPAEYQAGEGSKLGRAAALEVGYEDVWSDSRGWSLHLRYGATGFTRSDSDTEYYTYTNQHQNATELTLAAGLSWF